MARPVHLVADRSGLGLWGLGRGRAQRRDLHRRQLGAEQPRPRRAHRCLQTGAIDCGRPNDKAGFFVALEGELKVPIFGAGDRIGAGVRFSQGGSSGFGGGLNLPAPDLFGAGNNLAAGWLPEGGSGIELTTAWSVQAGYDHQWSPSREHQPVRRLFQHRPPTPTAPATLRAPYAAPAAAVPPRRPASTANPAGAMSEPVFAPAGRRRAV